MNSSTTTTSLLHVLATVFPNGTQHLSDAGIKEIRANSTASKSASDDKADAWTTIPVYPYDVFAFCAYVIQSTGLMGFFDPDPSPSTTINKDGFAEFDETEPLKVIITQKRRAQCKTASRKWRKNGIPNEHTQKLWAAIQSERNMTTRIRDYQRVHKNAAAQSTTAAKEKVCAPNWWVAVFELLIIADEACEGVGHDYHSDSSKKVEIFDLFLQRTRESRAGEMEDRKEHGKPFVRAKKQLSTLALAADKGVVCVQPKGRVAEVGCTLRNISRNLSITGPVGGVRCSWQQLAGKPEAQESDSLNVLLIPLPYELKASSFAPAKQPEERSKWGNFKVSQDWINDLDESDLTEFVRRLIVEALKDVSRINAVIFPEYALNYDLFVELMTTVAKATDGSVEFMIAGSSSNCDDEECNCVLTAIWEDRILSTDVEPLPSTSSHRKVRIVSQKKHHRWKLEETQITDYGLSSSLAPYINWWETHDIEQRELNFFQFRKNAIFASLICEDLARNDPCHEILRSVAPNLIISLLMDGPQLANRWAARYASSLADDPGSTVLTFTSYGLLNRSNHYTEYEESHSVGLLRDDTGTTREIKLDKGSHGVLMTLASKAVTDFTIDGRGTTNASSWHYINQKCIKLSSSDPWDAIPTGTA